MTVRLRATIVLAVVLLGFYLATLGWRGVLLIADGSVVSVAFGVALLLIAGVGVWAAVAEIRFGVATNRLGHLLDDQDGLPADELPRMASGRVDRAAADAGFAGFRDSVEAAPEDWRAWYRLAIAYDLAGDRRRGRSAARTAIKLEREV